MSMKGGEESVGFILIKGTASFLKSTFYIVKRLI